METSNDKKIIPTMSKYCNGKSTKLKIKHSPNILAQSAPLMSKGFSSLLAKKPKLVPSDKQVNVTYDGPKKILAT